MGRGYLQVKVYEFDGAIKEHGSIDAAYIEFPYDVEQEFNTKGQIKVKVTFDGYEYRGSLAKMGLDCHILGITQKIRQAIDKSFGDMVHVILMQDEEVRTIDIPEDFQKELEKSSEAKDFFDTLSYTNRKKYVEWVISAKKAETRERRLMDSIAMLLDKTKFP